MLSPRGPAVESEICARCAASGTSHEAAEFAATSESLGGASAPSAVWLRPDAIFGGAAQLLGARGGGARLALGAAQLGDTGLLGALATLAASPALLRQLFVSTRGAAHGVYTCLLYTSPSPRDS